MTSNHGRDCKKVVGTRPRAKQAVAPMATCAKDHSELVVAWDCLAKERHRQISEGLDVSFTNVLAPTALRLHRACDASTVLDIGSGTGDFTALLARESAKVIGIDPSQRSTQLARSVCTSQTNVRFLQASLEELADALARESPTSAVAMMSLMTTPDLSAFALSLRKVLAPPARFVAVFTHPCYWPRYWGYEDAPWFRYGNETFIEAPFVTSKYVTPILTTHVHRPLEQYVETFREHGFILEELAEPMPSPDVETLYPRPWDFPRFIAMRWRRLE